jgi:hypothetical protein
MTKRNMTYLVKCKDLSDDTILGLLEYGSIDIVSDLINVVAVKTFAENKDSLKKCNNVISVEKNRIGSFNV